MRVDKAAYLKDTCKVLLLSKLDEKIIFNINIEYMKSCLLNLAFFFFFFYAIGPPHARFGVPRKGLPGRVCVFPGLAGEVRMPRSLQVNLAFLLSSHMGQKNKST